jgi:hypothetical protein
VHTLASLDVEASPEPYVYMTRAGRRVSWPDPGDLDAFEADEFLAEMDDPSIRLGPLLTRWLGDDAVADLKAEKLTLRQMSALLEAVKTHYQLILGTPGESDASES